MKGRKEALEKIIRETRWESRASRREVISPLGVVGVVVPPVAPVELLVISPPPPAAAAAATGFFAARVEKRVGEYLLPPLLKDCDEELTPEPLSLSEADPPLSSPSSSLNTLLHESTVRNTPTIRGKKLRCVCVWGGG